MEAGYARLIEAVETILESTTPTTSKRRDSRGYSGFRIGCFPPDEKCTVQLKSRAATFSYVDLLPGPGLLHQGSV
jgi:hypothetical protein